MDQIARKTVSFKCKFTWRIKMDIFHFNKNMHHLLFSSFLRSSSPSSFLFFFSFLLWTSIFFLDYFFIWRPIYSPSVPMTDPQYRFQGDGFGQSDPLVRAPYFPQNHVGFNVGETVLPLSRLHLHRSSQAGNEVGFFWVLCFIL